MSVLPLLLALTSQTPASQPQGAAVTLAANTKISVTPVHPLSSKDAVAGHDALFTLAEDVKDDQGHILVAKGTQVRGTVTAVQRPGLFHSRGLIGFQLVALQAGDHEIPVHVEETDHKFHDYRTRETCGPRQTTPTEVAQFYGQRQAANDLVTQAAQTAQTASPALATQGGHGQSANGKGSSGAADVIADPLEENSAVLLSQILDFSKSQELLKSYSNTNLWHVVNALSSGQGLSTYTRKFSAGSAVSLVGAGFGLWKVGQIGGSFYHQAQIAPGAIFTAETTQSAQVEVHSNGRGFIRRHPHVRPPTLSPASNFQCDEQHPRRYRLVKPDAGA